MRFTMAQVQELTGVRREQMRHWKKVLPPLGGRDGRSDDYVFADVLAIALVATMVDGLGISVSRLAGCADEVFALFHDHIDPSSDAIIHLDESGLLSTSPPDKRAYVSVRVDKIVSQVMERLAPEQRRQLAFPFAR